MGLGKTLTMISLVLKLKAEKENEEKGNRDGGTLVICPASLLNQWDAEITRRVRFGELDVEVYHGAKRETRPKR